jgi:hypothetical protein
MSFKSVQIRTTTASSKLSAPELQDFMSRPIHWPQIVASSDRVEVVSSSNNKSSTSSSLPLRPGMVVQEYFGLGLLSVEWTCRQSTKGTFVMESPNGVPGIATDCSMSFDFQDNQITLTMGYTPVSPLAIFATPVLIVDNWIALNILLPAAVDPHPIDSFRKLMGALYGIAGLAHLADLVVGNSILLTSIGLPAFDELSLAAQAYALLFVVNIN